MNNQLAMTKDVDHIINCLDIEQFDLRIEVKDHLICLLQDKMDNNDVLSYKEAIQASRFEITQLIHQVKATIADQKRDDLIKIIFDVFKTDSLFVSFSLAALVFFFYKSVHFFWVPDFEIVFFIALFAFIRLRWLLRRKKINLSYSNLVLRRYCFVPILAALGFSLISLITMKALYSSLEHWNLDFILSIPISLASIAGGMYLKMILDTSHKIPDMINNQSQIDRALREIGYAV